MDFETFLSTATEREINNFYSFHRWIGYGDIEDNYTQWLWEREFGDML